MPPSNVLIPVCKMVFDSARHADCGQAAQGVMLTLNTDRCTCFRHRGSRQFFETCGAPDEPLPETVKAHQQEEVPWRALPQSSVLHRHLWQDVPAESINLAR